MTNEEITKLDNYRGQMTQFSLKMEDEMRLLQNAEWEVFAKELIDLAARMGQSIATKIQERGENATR